MLKISKLADYATVIMHRLASNQDQHYSAAALAEAVSINRPTVSKVLKMLNDAGLVNSVQGVQGGYHLSRDANKVSLAEIIAAIDGQLAMTECAQTDSCCQYGQQCGISDNWQFINKVIYDVLDKLSIKDMTGCLSTSNEIPIHFYPTKTQREKHVS